jgi:hypothetical protein
MNILFRGTVDAQGDAVRTADSFANRSRALQSAIKDLSVEIGATLLPHLAKLFETITNDVIPAFREFALRVGLIQKPMTERLKDIENQLDRLSEKRKKMAEAGRGQEKSPIMKELEAEAEAIRKQIEAQDELAAKREEKDIISAQATKDEEAQQKLNERLQEARDIMERYRTEEEKINEQLSILRENLLFLSEEEAPLAEQAISQLEQQLRELDPLMQELDQIFDRAMTSISQSIADSITEGKNLMESLGNIAKQVVNQMIAEFLRLQVIKPLMSSIFGGMGGGRSGGGGIFGNILGSLFSFGSVALAPSTGGGSMMVGGGMSSAFASMRPFAGGGSVSPNRAVMVGERGPEIFVPNSGGKIVPNHNMKALGGQETVINQNINITTGVSQTVRAEVLNMLPAIKQETLQAVADSRLRGGTFGAAFTR